MQQYGIQYQSYLMFLKNIVLKLLNVYDRVNALQSFAMLFKFILS